MRRKTSYEGRQSRIEDSITNNQIAILMIFVPAAIPVGNNDVRLVPSNCVANCKSAFFVVWDLGVGIRKKYRLQPEQASCFLRRCTLHFAVMLNRDIFRSSPLSERET